MVLFDFKNYEVFHDEFYSFLLNSNYANQFKAINARGDIIVHIYEKQLRELRIIIPPKNEQKKIADYLHDKTEKIDSIIKNHQKKIELLEEQRSALISNVVTGKIRVS
ncbi:MAG: restriction endonuclease subunit S [Dehalococcoidia bacterium]